MLWTSFVLVLATYLTGSFQGVRGNIYERYNGQQDEESLGMRFADEIPLRSEEVLEMEQTSPSAYVNETKPLPSTNSPLNDTFNTTKYDPGMKLESVTPSTEVNLSKSKKKEKKPTVSYIVYKKNNEPKVSHNPDITLLKRTFFLIPGVSRNRQTDYENDFFDQISAALLDRFGNECNVVGVKWSSSLPKGFINQNKEAVSNGHLVAKVINNLRKKAHRPRPIVVIAHDLGNVLAAAISVKLDKPLHSIFGLDQRILPHEFKQYYLRMDMFYLVQTLNTKPFRFDYGHRNFYPNGGHIYKMNDYHYDDGEEYNDYSDDQDFCFYCQSYRFLADDIIKNGRGHPATFCSSQTTYDLGQCSNFPNVSYFNEKRACSLPYGRYFSREFLTPQPSFVE